MKGFRLVITLLLIGANSAMGRPRPVELLRECEFAAVVKIEDGNFSIHRVLAGDKAQYAFLNRSSNPRISDGSFVIFFSDFRTFKTYNVKKGKIRWGLDPDDTISVRELIDISIKLHLAEVNE